jgi:helix-turn-helix protein
MPLLDTSDASALAFRAATEGALPSGDDLVNTAEASKITTLAVSTLETLRCRGGGPPYYKISRRVVYRRADLLAFACGGGLLTSTSDRASK